MVRSAAWLIIFAAIVDPRVPVRSRVLPRVAILHEAAARDAAPLARALADELDGVVTIEPAAAGADAVVLIADRYPRSPLPASRPLHVLSAASRRERGVTIAQASVPSAAVLRLPVAVVVEAERRDETAARTTFRLADRGVVVATRDLQWRAGQRVGRVVLTYVPSRTGPVRLRVLADAAAADVLTEVRETRFDVRVSATRPSWALTYAGSALQTDDRLAVTTRVSTAPGRAVETRSPRPDAAQEADVLVVGPDLGDLSAARRAAERGGIVILVPDRAVPDTVGRLAGAARLRERVMSSPARASNGLRASEWILADRLSPAAAVHATVAIDGRDFPVAVEMPLGAGRVVLVTALDAWRYRSDPEYARFWRALVIEEAAEQAERTHPMRVAPRVTRPGDPLDITWDAPDGTQGETVSARVVEPAGRTRPITLIRTLGRTYVGRTDAPPAEGLYRVARDAGNAAIADSVPFIVAGDAAAPYPAAEASLRALAASHGGTFVPRDAVATLARTLRDTLTPHEEPVRRSPMRWPGWSAVLAALLGAEWWSRRRNGLR